MITETIETPSTILYTTRNEALCVPSTCPIRELGEFARRGAPSYQDVYVHCMEQRFMEPMDQIKILNELSTALGPTGVFSVDCPYINASMDGGITCGNVVGVDQSRFRTTGRLLRILSDDIEQQGGHQNG